MTNESQEFEEDGLNESSVSTLTIDWLQDVSHFLEELKSDKVGL